MKDKVKFWYAGLWPSFLVLMMVGLLATAHAQNRTTAILPLEFRNQTGYQRGQYFHRRLSFDSAIINYRQYHKSLVSQHADREKLKEVEKRILECESGIILMREPRRFSVIDLGSEINSPYEDYAPVLSEDERTLVFTSRRPDGNLNVQKLPDGKYFEDVFLAHKENGGWSQAENMGPPVNTMYHDSDLALSADGKQLFLYSDANEGDILISSYLNGKWSQPKPLPSPINTPYHESSISTDGKRFFVASERPGGMGGSDIWQIEKNSTGQWKSTNLGASINTEWDEDGPFIDYDGATLYFSSRGHNAMGGFDIFRSLWKTNHWVAAENLGFPINTPENDSYFVGTRDGKRAYYSSVRKGGFGAEDIYMISLPKELEREEKVKNTTDGALGENPELQEGVTQPSLVIYFGFRSSVLSDLAHDQLEAFLRQVKEKGSIIHLAGHTDDVGSVEFNESLSMARAIAVESYFKSNGIHADRLKPRGWGAKRPAASNGNEKDGRALNRRVEIRVINN